MRSIPLTQGYAALVDDDDYERLAQYTWYAHPSELRNTWYARTNIPIAEGGRGEYKAWYMHRMIMGVLDNPNLDVHHKDENGLHNFKSNLEVMDSTQHKLLHEGVRSDSTTGYRGVTYNKRRRKYRARLYMYYTLMLDSYHDTPEEASAAYEAARKKLGL